MPAFFIQKWNDIPDDLKKDMTEQSVNYTGEGEEAVTQGWMCEYSMLNQTMGTNEKK